jgi:hypothetical protein
MGLRSGDDLLDRMVLAVQRVRERLRLTAATLEREGIPYAVADDFAVAAWVATIDTSAVRNSPDIDVLLRRSDLDRATDVLTKAGIDVFLDRPNTNVRHAVRLVVAGEKVRPEHDSTAPDVAESERPAGADAHVVALEPLVRMKLDSSRTRDRVHLRDMLDVGLIDATWVPRLGQVLGARLQQLIDTPEG